MWLGMTRGLGVFIGLAASAVQASAVLAASRLALRGGSLWGHLRGWVGHARRADPRRSCSPRRPSQCATAGHRPVRSTPSCSRRADRCRCASAGHRPVGTMREPGNRPGSQVRRFRANSNQPSPTSGEAATDVPSGNRLTRKSAKTLGARVCNFTNSAIANPLMSTSAASVARIPMK